MASFMGVGLPLRTLSTLPLTLPLPFHQRTQLLLQASHLRSSARLVLISVRSSSNFYSSSALEEPAGTEEYVSARPLPLGRRFPALSPKEKKDLRAYAHSLGKKIISQQIGKQGVTDSLAKAISDALEAKEILKLKVLDNCPDDMDAVITKIEAATQGQVVGKIGSVITLYRPSLRKLSEGGKSSQNKGLEGGIRRTMSRRT